MEPFKCGTPFLTGAVWWFSLAAACGGSSFTSGLVAVGTIADVFSAASPAISDGTLCSNIM